MEPDDWVSFGILTALVALWLATLGLLLCKWGR